MLAALDLADKTLVIYVASIIELVHLSWKTLIAGLEMNKVIVSTKYLDFAEIFSLDSKAEFSEHTNINNYSIYLIKN